jgi:hypothetical protein
VPKESAKEYYVTKEHVTVVYKWTAKPGKLDELQSI